MDTNTDGTEKVRIRLDLTDKQRAQVRDALGREGKAIELAVEPLEERVSPIIAILIG